MPKKTGKGSVTPRRRGPRGEGRLTMKQREDAERRRKAFRAFMDSRNLKVAEWCKRAGFRHANKVYNFLNGLSQSLSTETLQALAEAEGVQMEDLIGDFVLDVRLANVKLQVLGAVEAGRWKEAVELPVEERRVLTLVAAPISSPEKTFGLIVRGNSMNRMYPPGTILECIKYYDFDRPLKNGDKIIVYRRNRQGLIEATCKEFQLANGHAWLWPRSDDPQHQQPISIPWPPDPDQGTDGNGIEAIDIHAVVIRSIRDEI